MTDAIAAGSTPSLHVDSNVGVGVAPIACVSIVPGVGDHGGRYAYLRDELLSHRIVSQVVDLRGHGRSPGARTDVGDFIEYCEDVEWLMARASPALPHFLLGHSMGGVVAVLVAARARRELAGLILLSPGLQPAVPFAWLLRYAAMFLGRVMPGLRLPLGFGRSSLTADPDMLREDERDPLLQTNATLRWGRAFFRAADAATAALERLQLPILALHGDQDRVASAAATVRAVEKGGSRDRSVEIVRRGLHELFREQPEIRRRVVRIVAEWIGGRARLVSRGE